MRHPIRTKLYMLADLALAFTTLDAVRLPERAPADADASTHSSSCAATADCAGGQQRRVPRQAQRGRRPSRATRHTASDLR